MRDCAEAESRPAGPACCLRDCKLSLRMQTDMQDRHHLPVLPSTTENRRPMRRPSASLLLCSPLRAAFKPLSPRHVYEVSSSASSASIPLRPACHLGSFSSMKTVSLQQSLTTAEAAATQSLFNASLAPYRR